MKRFGFIYRHCQSPVCAVFVEPKTKAVMRFYNRVGENFQNFFGVNEITVVMKSIFLIKADGAQLLLS